MEHRRIALLLKLAGAVAAAGILFVFYVYPHLGLGHGSGLPRAPQVLFAAAMGLPYLAALFSYFRICTEIARNRSFCRDNARRMKRVARLLTLAALLWLAVLPVILLASGPSFAALMSARPYLLIIAALASMASFAVALVAMMLSLLLGRAAALQEDSDLTI